MPTSLEQQLLDALRRSDFTAAYSAWVAIRETDTTDELGLTPAGGAASRALKAAVALLTKRAAPAAGRDSSHSWELLSGLAVFCGSVPETCKPIFGMLSHPEAAAAARSALEIGLSRSGDAAADFLFSRAKAALQQVGKLAPASGKTGHVLAGNSKKMLPVVRLLYDAATAARGWSAPLTLVAAVQAGIGDLDMCVESAETALLVNPYDVDAKRQWGECVAAQTAENAGG